MTPAMLATCSVECAKPSSTRPIPLASWGEAHHPGEGRADEQAEEKGRWALAHGPKQVIEPERHMALS
jgi:hypothetical protein